jgi:glycosyltransferase involved in cell wall biosynthesis
MRLSVVMPVFNEERTIGDVIGRILTEIPYDLELIVIDDGSTDGTAAIADGYAAQDRRVQVVHQPNGGKTSALKRGFALTRGDIVIVQDADLEYDPAEIDHVIQPILQGKADVVYGSRFLVRRAARVLYFYHYVANRFLTLLSNVLTNLNMTDIETGYKAFRGDIIRSMIIESNGFGIEVEITAKVAKLGAVIYEVPISYYGRTYQEGKKIHFSDGVLALYYILRFNLFRRRDRSFHTIPEPHVSHAHNVNPLSRPGIGVDGLRGELPSMDSAKAQAVSRQTHR